MELRILYYLFSLAINNPIIKSFGLHFTKIPILFVPTGQTRNISRMLCSSDFVTLCDESIERTRLNESLVQKRYGMILIACNSSKHCAEMIEYLHSVIISGCVQGVDINATPVLISEDPYVEDKDNYLLAITLSENDSEANISIDDVVPDENFISSVMNIHDKHKQTKDSMNMKVLEMAAVFIYGVHHDEVILNNDVSMIDKIIKLDEEYHDTSGMDSVFLAALDETVKDNSEIAIMELPNVDHITEAKIENVIFYTNEYIYLSDVFFKKIADSKISYIPINALKRGLSQSGLFVTDNCSTNTYTVKMNYVTEMGQNKSKRMFKISRKLLVQNGELDFIEEFNL